MCMIGGVGSMLFALPYPLFPLDRDLSNSTASNQQLFCGVPPTFNKNCQEETQAASNRCVRVCEVKYACRSSKQVRPVQSDHDASARSGANLSWTESTVMLERGSNKWDWQKQNCRGGLIQGGRVLPSPAILQIFDKEK